jgi:electron transfer flavoprotein alpha subunit
MADKIWVYIDHYRGQAVPASWEVLGAGLELAAGASGVTAVIFGQNVEALARQAAEYGASTVLLADDSTLQDFRPEPFASLLSEQANQHKPEAILFPTTTRGRELAGMAAVDLKTGVLPDAVSLEVVDGEIEAVRPIYGGKLLAKVKCLGRPQLITLRARSFARSASQPGRAANVIHIPAVVTEDEIATRVESLIQPESRVSLSDAGVVVSGGRGVANNPALQPPAGLSEKDAEIWRAKEGFKLVAELAEALGGAVGASRAAVDAGFIPYAHQVGQTGKLISPDLYIACGISGAIQHLAGMRTSKVIVAINRDPDAPIFKLARYGVVGDLHTLLPAISAEFRKRLQT